MRASVLIPTFDRADMLAQAIASVSGARVIVYDDGSTEDIRSVCKRHGARYIRGEHAGVGHACNALLDACDTPVGMWLGSDDLCTHDRVRVMCAYLTAHQDVDIAFSALAFFSARMKRLEIHRIDIDALDKRWQTWKGNLATGTAAFRVDRVRRERFVEDLQTGGSDALWAYQLKAHGHRFGYVDRVTYYCRRHAGRLTYQRTKLDGATVRKDLDEHFWPRFRELQSEWR